MSLRILHVLQRIDSDAGRSAEAVCELSIGQRQFGHAVEIALVGPGSEAFEHLGIPVHNLSGGWGAYGYSSDFVPWMRDHSGGFDCVIVHGIWTYCGLGTLKALHDLNVPYFVFTHGMLDPWKKINQPLRHLMRWLYWPWGAYPVLRDAHAVFFLCEDERHRARETFWLYDCHEFVVRFGSRGIPPEISINSGKRFNDAHPELAGKRLFMLIADQSSFVGIESVVGAVASLVRSGLWNTTTMRLVVVGMTGTAPEAPLKGIVDRSGISECISLFISSSERAIWDALQSAEVFLRPSSYEICCTRVAESLSAGTPVLISTGVAIWKDIVNDGAGYAADATYDGEVNMIRRWISLSEGERQEFRKRAKRCFEGRYTSIGAAHTLTSAIYLLVGVHRDSRWNSRPLKPASELS
jgi:glycosyltransferase involved in cell wall biosynthesis